MTKKNRTCVGSEKQYGPRTVGENLHDSVFNSNEPKQEAKKSVFFRDLRNKFKPDVFAEGLLISCFPEWLSDRLRRQVVDALRGLDEAMAIEVADDVMDFWTYGVRHYVGILYIDNMLNSLYNKIAFCAEQQEIELPMHF